MRYDRSDQVYTMPRSPTARIRPDLLVWARESIGYTPEEVAQKLRQPLDKVLAWESGKAQPTIAQLRSVANIYKRPLAVFYLSEPPLAFQAMRDFRRLPSEEGERRFSPELLLAIRTARARREVALDLLRDAGDEPSLPVVARSKISSVTELAAAARDLLGVQLEEQQGWRDKYEALRGWITALESLGVLVFHASGVALSEMRGFSISDPPLAVIVANGKDSPRGRVFTLMHEFAHVLLKDGGLCDLREAEGTQLPPERRTEVFCNQVAAEILVPGASLLEAARDLDRQSGDWADADLVRLAARFSVSREVILRRLLTLGLTSGEFYRRKRGEFLEAYAQQPAVTGRPSYHRIQVRDLGRAYLGLVLDAYHREAINSSDLSEYLGVRLKHVQRLEQEAFGI